MCVIIVRNPGIEIDPEKISSACEVNAHGFGVSIVDRGKLETIKYFNDKGNDPRELTRIFEQAKNQLVFAHLRFSTKGAKNQDNCHPIRIFQDGDHEAYFMHNGTINNFGNDDISDSREFAETILSPLTEAFFEIDDMDLFDNKTYNAIIEKYRPGGSVFTLYDSQGKYINMGSGVQYDGWWASNSYSFNRTHRSTNTSYSYKHSNWDDGDYNNNIPWNNQRDRQLDKFFEKTQFWRLGDYYNSYKNEWGRWDGSTWNPNIPLSKIDKRTQHYVKVEEVKTKEKGKYLSIVPNTDAKTSSTSATTENATKKDPMAQLREDCAAIGQAIHHAKKANLEPAIHTLPEKRMTFAEFAEIGNLEDVNVLDEEQLYELCERWPLAATMLLMDLIFENFTKKQAASIKANADTTPTTEEKKVVNQ